MSNKKENQEIVEVEILTAEQIEALDIDIKDDITFLVDNMNGNKVAVINPVIKELENLKQRVFSLSLIPADTKGKFDKDNIQEYKDLKANTKSFNTTIKAVSKSMKDPLNETKKHIINIEKTILEEAASILEAIDVEFKPYVDEQERKAAIAKKKKDDALNAKVAEAEAETKKVLEQSKKVETVNKIKYDLIADKITGSTSNHIANSNLKNINEHKTYIDAITFEKLVECQDVMLIDDDVLKDLETLFDAALKNAKSNIETRIEALELEIKNRVNEEMKKPENATHIPYTSVPVRIDHIPVVDNVSSVSKVEQVILEEISMMNGFEFADYCANQIKFVLELIDKEIANGNDCSPKIYSIKSIINPIKDIV